MLSCRYHTICVVVLLDGPDSEYLCSDAAVILKLLQSQAMPAISLTDMMPRPLSSSQLDSRLSDVYRLFHERGREACSKQSESYTDWHSLEVQWFLMDTADTYMHQGITTKLSSAKALCDHVLLWSCVYRFRNVDQQPVESDSVKITRVATCPT